MFREITLGQYYAADSVVHKLDPRVKLLGTLIYIISVLMAGGLTGYFIAAIAYIIVMKISRVPFSFALRGLKSVFWIVLMTFLCNAFFYTGGTPFIKYGVISISISGIEYGISMAVRLVLLVLGSSILTLTTTPNELTYGLEKAFSFLCKVNVPVQEIALMMSIALRFIPILIEETDKIMKAQASRGTDFETGSIIKRVQNYIPIIIPLFISAFRRAGDLALAMESRCYRTGYPRTKMYPLKYNSTDGSGYTVLLIYLSLFTLLKCVLIYIGKTGFFTM